METSLHLPKLTFSSSRRAHCAAPRRRCPEISHNNSLQNSCESDFIPNISAITGYFLISSSVPSEFTIFTSFLTSSFILQKSPGQKPKVLARQHMTPGSWHLSPPPPDCESDFTWETVQLTYAIKITCAARQRITKRRQAFAILAYVCKEKEHLEICLTLKKKNKMNINQRGQRMWVFSKRVQKNALSGLGSDPSKTLQMQKAASSGWIMEQLSTTRGKTDMAAITNLKNILETTEYGLTQGQFSSYFRSSLHQLFKNSDFEQLWLQPLASAVSMGAVSEGREPRGATQGKLAELLLWLSFSE